MQKFDKKEDHPEEASSIIISRLRFSSQKIEKISLKRSHFASKTSQNWPKMCEKKSYFQPFYDEQSEENCQNRENVVMNAI